MALGITTEQRQLLQSYIDNNNYQGGWKYLAEIGDNYADNAYAVTTGCSVSASFLGQQYDQLMQYVVRSYWDTVAGPEAYNQKFDDVALQHFQQYVSIINFNNGELPDSQQIEKSYRDAVVLNDLPPNIAIDAAITRAVGDFLDKLWPGGKHEGLDWTDALGMEDERQVPSNLNGDIDSWQALKDLTGAAFDGLWAKISDDLMEVVLHVSQHISQLPNQNLPDYSGDPFTGLPWPGGLGISDVFAALGINAATPPQAASTRVRDPLALDMDGDGIETTGLNGSTILFDHNADGVKTGTGWVQGDDAWLVRDLNGNGTIDTGRELFGEDTIKTNGQLAIDGFDALRDLDLNRDGLINAADDVFGQLRLWKDLNQDGISQAGELSNLAANSIVSIGVNGALTNVNLGNGNVQTAAGTFVRSDGSAGSTSETSSSIVNLDLIVNSFDREFTDSIELSDLAIQLPNLRGSGMVRDLNEAVSLSPALANTVQNYASQQTRAGQMGLVDSLVEQWADSSNMKSLKQQAEALSGSGVSLVYQLAGLTQGTASYNEVVRKIGVVERFMGFTYGTANGAARFNELTAADGTVTVSLVAAQIQAINSAYGLLKTEVYDGLLFTTRFKNYLDQISLVWVNDEIQVSTDGLENAFTADVALQPETGLLNLFEFITASGPSFVDSVNWDANLFIKQLVESDPAIADIAMDLPSSLLRVLNGTQTSLTLTGNTSDFLIGNALGNTLKAGAGNDLLIGRAGIDRLNGEAGNDTLYGGSQNDFLTGGDGHDLLDGDTGDDMLEGEAGNDIFVFGRGYGRDHVTAYNVLTSDFDVIQLNEDLKPEDIVVSRSYQSLFLTIRGTTESLQIQYFFESNGAPSHKIDEVRFADGTVWTSDYLMQAALQGSTGVDNLIGYATADTILAGAGNDTVSGGAGGDELYGEDGNDIIRGDDGADALWGGVGDDRLEGGTGDDTLEGNVGADTLIAGSGNDVLDGGAGNDTLDGGLGNDTYTFARGFGQDTISSSDSGVSKLDAVVFAQDILPTEVVFIRTGADLKLTVLGTSDALTITSYFQQDGASPYRLEEIRFADGTTWSIAHIKEALLTGTSASETIWGYATADSIFGNAGDDSLYGRDGNDVLDGDVGNDKLYGDSGNDLLNAGQGNDFMYGGIGDDLLDGGAGNDYMSGNNDSDTYIFGRGDGQDTIDNFDTGLNKVDVVLFKADVLPSDISISRVNTNLVLKINGTADSLTVVSYFDQDVAGPYKLEEIKFSNGAVWNIDDVKARVLQGTAQAQTLIAYASNDVINAGGGNDSVYGRAGADIIFGSDGDDKLFGEDGDDFLDGGLGNDFLYGGAGDDVFNFGRGYGTDNILDYGGLSAGKGVLLLTPDVLTSDLKLSRQGDDLLLSFSDSTDIMKIWSYFYQDAAGGYQLEQIRFADNTVWTVDQVKTMLLTGDEQANTIKGYATADSMFGEAGNDTMNGGLGNDIMYGGDDNDMIRGENGDDFLFGDAGDDILYGGNNNDTLNGGAGLDHLYGDAGNDNLYGEDGADYVRGGAGDDVLTGNSGDDRLYGDEGLDWLDDMQGNDLLDGGSGNDTYVFGRGYGQDTINSNDVSTTKLDVIRMNSDVTQADLMVSRYAYDLIIAIRNSTDSITVKNHFIGNGTSPYEIEEVIFSDQTSWDINQLNAMVLE